MAEVMAPTQEEIVYLVSRRYGTQYKITSQGHVVKMRQGLNKGVNVVVRSDGIEVVPRSFLDDHSKMISSGCGVALGFIFILWMYLMATEAHAMPIRWTRLGRKALAVVGGFALGAFIGASIAAVVIVMLSPKSTLDANRVFARGLNTWLTLETK